jgi:hypothetical protein
MLVFPQLSSGAVSQMPLKRQTEYRTLLNQSLDGNEVRVADASFVGRAWQLPLQSLSDQEWQAIQTLFAAAEGQLQTFLFLEPGGNLLEWSEGFTQAAWVAAGITIAGGITDPTGGAAASELTGAGTLSQSLNIPVEYRYAASIWARTSQPGASLQLSDGASQQASAAFADDGQWHRYMLGTAWTGSSQTVVFTVTTGGAATLDIYGAQLEAQPQASAYKQTLQQSGVHPAARFGSDTLGDRATSPSQHSGVLQIKWTPSQT